MVFPVKYYNLPENKVVANQLPEEMTVDLKSTGFRLLWNKITNGTESLYIDVKNLKLSGASNEYYFETHSALENISKQLNNNFKVNRIYPDVINFSFRKKSHRKVPIKLNALFSFKKQYQINGKVSTNPQYIIVSGDLEQINKIKYIETENLVLRDLDKPTEHIVRLKLPENIPDVSLSLPVANVKIPVEKYTETTVEVNVMVLNLPSNYSVKTFPEKIKITFNVPLSKYESVKPELFILKADYQETVKDKSNKLKIVLAVKPDYVKNVKIETDKAEFILKGKR